MADEVLQDDPHRRVIRIGDTVRRPMHPWSPTIHEVLQHLERTGFEDAPRVLGVDEAGREVLTWRDGESGGDAWAKVVMWHGNRPVGILDWDYALPARPVFDVAYALEYVTPFRDDDFAERRLRHPAPPDRRRRLELFTSAYGLTSTDGEHPHDL